MSCVVEPTYYADALAEFAGRDTIRAMVPGHAATATAAPRLADYFGDAALLLDVTPLLPGLDLGEDSPLNMSVRAAARAFSARRTWFLTNGASQANRIAALAVAQMGTPDQPLVAQRSAHSSLFDGAVIAGLPLAFVMPTIDNVHGINHGITPEAFREALANRPDARAAYIISPSYFGAVADVPALAEIAHDAGIPLIVDAAWAAHFGFHPDLPANPLTQGADLVVSSTHKLGGSLTQSAMLHLGEGPFADVLEPLIDRAFRMTASTSTSSLLLASLDIARAELCAGIDAIGRAIDSADALRAAVRSHPCLDVVSDHYGDFAGIVGHDPLHVAIDVRGLGKTGHEVRNQLMRDHDVYVEIATNTCVVAIIGPGYEPDVDRIVTAMGECAASDAVDIVSLESLQLPAPGPAAMRPRDAFFAATELVTWDRAIGRVSADALAAYPPGIPNVLPGEVITAQTAEFLRTIAASPGGYVRGAADAAVDHMRVVTI